MMSPLICKYRAAVKKNAQNGDLAETSSGALDP